jgi:UDPglucose 6-dehydrogenase
MGSARERSAKLVPGLEIATASSDALAGADIAILVTEWPEFVELDWAAVGATMRRRVLIDGRNVLAGDRLAAEGFAYSSFGRGTIVPAGTTEGAVTSSARVTTLQWGEG